MTKRVVIGVMALVVFGICLSFLGRLDPLVEVGERAFPDVRPAPGVSEPEVPTVPVSPAGDGEGGGGDVSLLSVLDAIPSSRSLPAAPQYERELFGPRWADVDRNGCDTRNDVLARDLEGVAFKPGTGDCVVVEGSLTDPYSGQVVPFVKADAADVPIDHVVPLAWAWRNGAAGWSESTRAAFANDPMNLQATTRSQNSSKSDKGPSEWMPADGGYACTYVERFLRVLTEYELSIGDRDRASVRRTLAGCV